MRQADEMTSTFRLLILERLLQRRCGLVDRILGRVLRVTCRFLSVAL